MNILNESLMKTVSQNLTNDDNVTETVTAVTPGYADAIDTGKKVETELAKRFKEQEKAKDEFVKANHNTELKVKGTKEMKKMKLSESLFDEPVVEEKPLQEGQSDIYYKSTREPLADIIQQELTSGEIVYKLNKDGKYIMTWAPSLNLDEYDIGFNEDSKGEYIIAHVPSEDVCTEIEIIAKKYGKDFESGIDKYTSGNKFFTKIYIDEADWDEPYFDPRVQVRPDGRRKKTA